MKNTFKKALLATSIAAVAGFAQAAVVTVPGATTISQEGSVGATSVAAPDVTVTLGAEYTQNDTITFTLSGAEYDIANSTPVATFAAVGADTATLGFLSSTANSVTFRITAVTDAGADGVVFAGGTFVLSGMAFKTTSVTDAPGEITVTYSALTNNNQAIDTSGTLSLTNATVVAQLSSSVTKALNGVIDVENARQQFTAGDDSITTDVLIVTPVEAVAAVNDVTYSVATHTIKGDFSWMNTNATAGVDAGELAAAFAATTGGDDVLVSTINAAMDTITVTATDGGANAVEAHTFTFTNAGVGTGNAVLDPQSFTVSTSLAYDAPVAAAATKVVSTDISAGAWTLNGSVVKVPYLVVSDGRFGLIANVTNSGTKSGSIVLDVYDEAGTQIASNYPAGTSTAGSIVSVAAPLRAALAAAGKDLSATTKFSFKITTNVPANDIAVYAAYTDGTTTERAVVNTDMKVQTK